MSCCVCGNQVCNCPRLSEEQRMAMQIKIPDIDISDSQIIRTIGPVQRPDWHDWFFGIAFLVSQRSPDQSTRHGCVIVDERNHILAVGYNGFPRGVCDAAMPQGKGNKQKHLHIDHAEQNAVDNSPVNLRHHPGELRAYITGWPCYQCVKALWRNGVKELLCARRRGFSSPDPEEEKALAFFLCQHGVNMEIGTRIPNLGWLLNKDFIVELEELGFLEK